MPKFVDASVDSIGSAEEYRLSYAVGVLLSAPPGARYGSEGIDVVQAHALLSRLQRYCDYSAGQPRHLAMIAACADALKRRPHAGHSVSRPLSPARICAQLQLHGEVSARELAFAIAQTTRHEARLLLDEIDFLAQHLTAARDWDVTGRLGVLRNCLTTDASSSYALVTGCLHLLCQRAGEPMLLDSAGARSLLDDVSPEGARRLLRRLREVRETCKHLAPAERPVLFFHAMGYDGESRESRMRVERRLQEAAMCQRFPLNAFDVLSPAAAWSELAYSLHKPQLAQRFLSAQAGEELASVFVRENAQRDARCNALLTAAGVSAYLLPIRHPLRSTITALDPPYEKSTQIAA
jgi:hypothetical protein